MTLNSADLGGMVGSAGTNEWTINDSYAGGNGSLICLGFPFNYTIMSTQSQPAGIWNAPSSHYMHMVSDVGVADNILCCSFQAADGLCVNDETHFAKMTNDVSTLGKSSVMLSFWWLCAGGGSVYGEVLYSIDGGANWIVLNSPNQFQNQPAWTPQAFLHPAFNNQAQLRFGFRFLNQTSLTVQDPGFGIDDIVITAACQSSDSTLSVIACNSYTVPSGDETYLASGIYSDTIPNAAGCDSLLTLDVSVTAVDTSVNQSGTVLTANALSALYQWVDCNNGFTVIPGATGQSFTASSNGSYALVTTQNDCTDTSACYVVNSVAVDDIQQLGFSIYPNPSQDQLFVQFPNVSYWEFEVVDLAGHVVSSGQRTGSTGITESFSPGTYFLRVRTEGVERTMRFVRH